MPTASEIRAARQAAAYAEHMASLRPAPVQASVPVPVVEASEPGEPAERGRELFYAPSESIFGAGIASEMVSLGWSVFPQSQYDRKPGIVFGETIKWAADHDLRNRLPTSAALNLWMTHCATLNVACVFGPASSHTFAIDVDVTDAAMVGDIRQMAYDILGWTTLAREARAPKIALIYRHAADDVVRSVSRTLVGDDGHMLEILGAGKPLTFHGKHHKTGRYIKWLHDSPLSVGPMAAHLVTSAQVTEFMSAVEARYGFERSAASAGVDFSFSGAEDVSGCQVPHVDGERRTEGRYHLISGLCFAAVKLNAGTVYDAGSEGDDAVAETKAKLTAVALTAFHAAAECSGSRWTPEGVEREIKSNVGRTVDRVLNGDLALERPAPKVPTGAPVPIVRIAHRVRRPVVRPAATSR